METSKQRNMKTFSKQRNILQARKLLFLTIIILIIASCKMTQMSVKICYAPVFNLPAVVKTITVINRSFSDSTKKPGNIIESIVSGEALHGDKLASEDAVTAFTNEMNNYSSYKAILPAQHTFYHGFSMKIPKQLEWADVKKLCRANGSDALLVLENFDTNSDAILGTAISAIQLATTGGAVIPPVHYTISYYWRMYDTLSLTMIDEFANVLNQQANGLLPGQPVPTQMIRDNGAWIGQNYASRFIPPCYWEPREYFKKGNLNMEIAARKAAVNDWQGAIDLWSAEAKSSNRKVAGWACYNMAVGEEVLGNLDEAKKWCQKSYSDYGVKKARKYMITLSTRPQN